MQRRQAVLLPLTPSASRLFAPPNTPLCSTTRTQTFSANLLVNYLAEPRATSGVDQAKVAALARRIIAAGPLLEAFGNAATTNNSNSSRFGKYVQLHFDRHGTLCGASLQVQLLALLFLLMRFQRTGCLYLGNERPPQHPRLVVPPRHAGLSS